MGPTSVAAAGQSEAKEAAVDLWVTLSGASFPSVAAAPATRPGLKL